jgi:glycosyltransferase involved in cell wall biosynthesis
MRILLALTYYRPHTSGLTLYAERMARALVERGHEVTVLTSRYEPLLAAEEVCHGVRIVRAPVLARIGKGVLMPTIGWLATREVRRHDAVLLHLPQLDAAGIALRGRLFGKPTAIIYHCDLRLPDGRANRVVERVVEIANHVAAFLVQHIVAYTEDFAASSPLLRRFARKVKIALPPIPYLQADSGASRLPSLDEADAPVLGMATRFASEKGVEVLLAALPELFARHPRLQVWFAGQVDDVWGEESLRRRLLPEIARLEAQGSWRFLGVLSPAEMGEFYDRLSVLVVPSLNSTETFGLVQIEAMMHGVPVVASDLPGVRQPVSMTGLGRVVPVGDAKALAEAVSGQLEDPHAARLAPDDLIERFSPQRNAEFFERLVGVG